MASDYCVPGSVDSTLSKKDAKKLARQAKRDAKIAYKHEKKELKEQKKNLKKQQGNNNNKQIIKEQKQLIKNEKKELKKAYKHEKQNIKAENNINNNSGHPKHGNSINDWYSLAKRIDKISPMYKCDRCGYIDESAINNPHFILQLIGAGAAFCGCVDNEDDDQVDDSDYFGV